METVVALLILAAIAAAATRDSNNLNFYQRRIRQATTDRDLDDYPTRCHHWSFGRRR